MRFQVWLSILALTAASALAGPFQNGSLETNSCTPGGWGGSRLAGTSTCLSGWTITNSTRNIDLISTYWGAQDGSYSIDLNGSQGANGIEQTFDVLAGHTYAVSFWMSGNPIDNSVDPTKYLNAIVVSGTPSQYAFNTGGLRLQSMGWVQKTFTFGAGASSNVTLQFVSGSVSNLDFGPAIDNISVTDVTNTAVPEPVTLLLVAPALAGLAFFRRRK